VTQEPERSRPKPRAIDYVMWSVVALSMLLAARAVMRAPSLFWALVGMVYIALGGVLMWWRWQNVKRLPAEQPPDPRRA